MVHYLKVKKTSEPKIHYKIKSLSQEKNRAKRCEI